MSTLSMKRALLIGLSCLALCTQQAWAQVSSRTYLSGLGSDTNPCTRALPCQTLAGALPHTANFGEIDILDTAQIASGPITTIAQAVSIRA